MENDSCSPVKRLKIESNNFDDTVIDKFITQKHGNQDGCSKSEEQSQCHLPSQATNSIPSQLLQIELKYNQLFSTLTLEDPISHIYNPLEYAFKLHSQFVHKFCQSKKEILILGMNPGPWGMSQTGVPFGEISVVRDWFGITGEVEHPKHENPNRPVTGLLCPRSEVSGGRFWGAFKKAVGKDPRVCLNNCYVHNYCPLAFMKSSGRNITPAELKPHERRELSSICDNLLVEILLLLNVKTIVAVGRYVETQAKSVIKNGNLEHLKLLYLPHPSLRNAVASKIWEKNTVLTLKELLCGSNSEPAL